MLVCIAEFDRETSADLARQIAEKAPRGELKCYPFAHFDFYHPEIRTQVLGDQINFLRKHLMVAPQ
ncbi:MAG: hypothetical protein HC899_18880 [Leptolyngbyaceae cyanobacterium SM1_4_3]|nr:hypothetical protein [Leptolyngbyaceae cyanobacterium SM1_4_3]